MNRTKAHLSYKRQPTAKALRPPLYYVLDTLCIETFDTSQREARPQAVCSNWDQNSPDNTDRRRLSGDYKGETETEQERTACACSGGGSLKKWSDRVKLDSGDCALKKEDRWMRRERQTATDKCRPPLFIRGRWPTGVSRRDDRESRLNFPAANNRIGSSSL